MFFVKEIHIKIQIDLYGHGLRPTQDGFMNLLVILKVRVMDADITSF